MLCPTVSVSVVLMFAIYCFVSLVSSSVYVCSPVEIFNLCLPPPNSLMFWLLCPPYAFRPSSSNNFWLFLVILVFHHSLLVSVILIRPLERILSLNQFQLTILKYAIWFLTETLMDPSLPQILKESFIWISLKSINIDDHSY